MLKNYTGEEERVKKPRLTEHRNKFLEELNKVTGNDIEDVEQTHPSPHTIERPPNPFLKTEKRNDPMVEIGVKMNAIKVKTNNELLRLFPANGLLRPEARIVPTLERLSYLNIPLSIQIGSGVRNTFLHWDTHLMALFRSEINILLKGAYPLIPFLKTALGDTLYNSSFFPALEYNRKGGAITSVFIETIVPGDPNTVVVNSLLYDTLREQSIILTPPNEVVIKPNDAINQQSYETFISNLMDDVSATVMLFFLIWPALINPEYNWQDAIVSFCEGVFNTRNNNAFPPKLMNLANALQNAGMRDDGDIITEFLFVNIMNIIQKVFECTTVWRIIIKDFDNRDADTKPRAKERVEELTPELIEYIDSMRKISEEYNASVKEYTGHIGIIRNMFVDAFKTATTPGFFQWFSNLLASNPNLTQDELNDSIRKTLEDLFKEMALTQVSYIEEAKNVRDENRRLKEDFARLRKSKNINSGGFVNSSGDVKVTDDTANRMRESMIQIELRQRLQSLSPSLRFAMLVAGCLQLRSDQPLVLSPIDDILTEKIKLHPQVSGKNNIFYSTLGGVNNVSAIRAILNTVIEQEIEAYADVFAKDNEDPFLGGENLLAPNLVMARMSAWQYVLELLTLSNDGAASYYTMKFLFQVDHQGSVSLLYSFARLSAAYLTKDQEVQKVRSTTKSDKDHMELALQKAQLDMRYALQKMGYNVASNVYQEQLRYRR